ncbi:MAG: hypothetical protein H7145_17475 [Akkermansiaceae bacterium]|nr:hypothetical protein [Armatimonadota bacterium]
MIGEEIPRLSDLCRAFSGYPTGQGYRDVLVPWIPNVLRVLRDLEPYRGLNTRGNDYPVHHDDLHQWYALSRLHDHLILDFQKGEDFYGADPQQDGERRDWMARTGAASGPVAMASPDQYLEFFLALGFEPFDFLPYCPFRHEIVEVVEDPTWTGEAVVEHTFWPGWMFGEMLFARAGVRLRCAPDSINKKIAEDSRLYFTYWRVRRNASDLSHGWGSNSQWATSFRRDYDSGGYYHFNVDGKHPLGDGSEYAASFAPDRWKMHTEWEGELGDDALTMEERIELLVNRCFVRCDKSDDDRWPYDDTYTSIHQKSL